MGTLEVSVDEEVRMEIAREQLQATMRQNERILARLDQTGRDIQFSKQRIELILGKLRQHG
jgi:hypothetical protein